MTDQVAQPTPQFSVPAKPRAGAFIASIKTTSGRWRDVRVPRSVAPSHRAAEKWVAAHFDALARGAKPADLVAAPASSERTTFAALGPAILEARDKDVDAKKLSAATRSEFKTHWRLYFEPAFGKMAPHEVETKHLLDFRDRLAKTKEPRTVRNVFKNLSILFKVVLGRGLDPRLAFHPVRRAIESGTLQLPSADDGPIVHLSREVAAKLILSDAVPAERRARYALAFLSGLRDGEIAALSWGDVDFEAMTVRISRALPKTGGLSKTKTKASDRLIPLHVQAAPFLRAWKEEGWAKLVGWDARPEDPIFPNDRGAFYRPRSPELLRDDLATVGEPTECEGEPVDFHATRRSFATWMEEIGVPGETVERILGHVAKSVRAKHYSAATLAPLREALARLRLPLGDDGAPSGGGGPSGGGDEPAAPPSDAAPDLPTDFPTAGGPDRRKTGSDPTPPTDRNPQLAPSEATREAAPGSAWLAGAAPGLQNRSGAALLSWAGSIPVRFRRFRWR